MTEEKRKPAKAKKGKLRGRMPVKRTINLVLIDKDKINPLQALPAVLAIIVLAAVFSKFLVVDRLAAVSQAAARASQLQSDLNHTKELLGDFGDVETTYAHYTYEGMTSDELNRVDRTQVLELVFSILPVVEPRHTEANVTRFLNGLFRPAPVTGNAALDKARLARREALKAQLIPRPEYTVSKWNVKESLLTLEVTGQTLERLNLLARQIEQSPIVDSCSITTANKKDRKTDEDVWARIVAYLQQPPEASEEEVDAQ